MVDHALEAGGERNTIRAIEAFVREFEPAWPKAAAKLAEQREELLAFGAPSPDGYPLFKLVLERVLAELPRREHERATEMVRDVLWAGGKANTIRAIDAFLSEFKSEWPKAAAKLTEEMGELLAFFDLPVEAFGY